MLVEEILQQLNIEYDSVEHEAVYTVREMEEKMPKISGIGCKNLFLKTQKKEYYLFTLPKDKSIDLKTMAKKLGVTNFHFASCKSLEEILEIIPGSVTPLAIINDKENKVTVVLDQELKNKKILVHPNRNTATISIEYKDLIKFIEHFHHSVIEIEM